MRSRITGRWCKAGLGLSLHAAAVLIFISTTSAWPQSGETSAPPTDAEKWSILFRLLLVIVFVVIPMVIGALIIPIGGISNAIAIVAVGPILGAILVLRYAPETKGMILEEIQESLETHSTSGTKQP